MRISDWSSDVCSSDLGACAEQRRRGGVARIGEHLERAFHPPFGHALAGVLARVEPHLLRAGAGGEIVDRSPVERSEEHTSELQSLMRISYAVFCLKKKKNNKNTQ